MELRNGSFQDKFISPLVLQHKLVKYEGLMGKQGQGTRKQASTEDRKELVFWNFRHQGISSHTNQRLYTDTYFSDLLYQVKSNDTNFKQSITHTS